MSTSRAARLTSLGWLVTRAVTLVLITGPEGNGTGDLRYFWQSLNRLGDVGAAHTMVEYPLPAIGAVAVPWLPVHWLGGDVDAFALAFILATLVLDGAFTWLLARRAGHSRAARAGVGCWLLAMPVLGGLALARFDLWAGVAAATAVVVVAQQPRLGGALLAVAVSLKLWPLLLVPAVLTWVVASRGRRDGVQVLLAGLAVGAATLVLTLAVAPSRVLSPLTYQADRGLHVESVAATPAMTGWAFQPVSWRIWFSDFHAYEIEGPWVSGLHLLTALAQVTLVAGLALVTWRAVRAGTGDRTVAGAGDGGSGADAVAWTSVALVAGFLVASPVLSPQYLLWLLPVACAGLVVAEDERLLRWTVLLLVVAGLTHLVFPVLYTGLVFPLGDTPVAVTVLLLRNLALVALTAYAWRRAWAAAAGGGGVSPRTRQARRRGPAPEGRPASAS